MREAVVVVSDTHVNSLAGIRPAGVTNDSGDPIGNSKAGRWLLYTWKQNWNGVMEWIKDADRKTLVVNGDVCDLDSKFRTDRVVTRNPSKVVEMAVNLYEPVVEQFDDLVVIRGTESHVGGSGFTEELFAQNFDNTVEDSETGNSSWWHFRGMFGGVRFDIAHHVTMGGLRWTETTSLPRYAFETEVQYKVEWEEVPPDVVVRSHIHRYMDSGTSRAVRVYSTPCWQFVPPYLMRAGKYNERPHFGSLAFMCESGEYTCSEKRFVYRPKRGPVWKKK